MTREFPGRPLVGIAVILFRGDTVLLIRRARMPGAGTLSFPGGAQRLGETAEAAARRELAEETGVAAGALRLTSHADVIVRDEAASMIRFHYTVLHFAGHWQAAEPQAAGDVSDAFFLALDAVRDAGLDAAHLAALEMARARLQGN
jgi:ADP-ribose pyrophosphatase YjhB (NUDIX family)